MRPKHHQEALVEHYRKHGVGKTLKAKLAYWESLMSDGYSISHITSIKGKVAVLEQDWLVDNFPEDFTFC